ncbi:MAG TPA: hypothetical protein VFB12_17720 [Ktedonobacteraceae bacterium]|nr:hypothetical protein [Ktedonobacteraceae bacterium]
MSRVEFSNRAAVSYPPAYRFRSQWGLEAAFTFDAEGRLFFIGDHYTREAWLSHDAR